MNTCVFCNLSEREILRETPNTLTILSNPYLVQGHTLVMPKIHVQRLSELTKEIRYELIEEVMNVQELLIQKLGSPGCDLRCNYRPYLPDSRLKVSHLHFHILPRYNQDELYQKSMINEKQLFTDLTPELNKFLINKLK